MPIQLQILCSLLIDGCDPLIKGFSQSSKTIAQLVMYQYRKMTGHSSSVTSLRRHVKERETPVPVYVGLKLYASLCTKTVIQHFFSLGLSISYDRCLSICNNISLNMLKKYDLKVYLLLVILPLKHLPLLQRIILTSMLDQLRWRKIFMVFKGKSGCETKCNIRFESSW